MASFGTLLRAGGSLDLRCTRGILLAAGGADFFLGGFSWCMHGCCSCVWCDNFRYLLFFGWRLRREAGAGVSAARLKHSLWHVLVYRIRRCCVSLCRFFFAEGFRLTMFAGVPKLFASSHGWFLQWFAAPSSAGGFIETRGLVLVTRGPLDSRGAGDGFHKSHKSMASNRQAVGGTYFFLGLLVPLIWRHYAALGRDVEGAKVRSSDLAGSWGDLVILGSQNYRLRRY